MISFSPLPESSLPSAMVCTTRSEPETIQPPGQSFEQWFGTELAALARALNGGAG